MGSHELGSSVEVTVLGPPMRYSHVVIKHQCIYKGLGRIRRCRWRSIFSDMQDLTVPMQDLAAVLSVTGVDCGSCQDSIGP